MDEHRFHVRRIFDQPPVLAPAPIPPALGIWLYRLFPMAQPVPAPNPLKANKIKNIWERMIIFILIIGTFLPFLVWYGSRLVNSAPPTKPEMPVSAPLLRPRRWGEQVIIILAAILSWATLFLVYRFGDARYIIGFGTLWGSSTLALTYFALGGGIPRKLRQKGWEPLTIIPVVFWVSMLAFIIVTTIYK